MTIHLLKPFSALPALLLALALLTVLNTQTLSAVSDLARFSQPTMPDGLLDAMLAATARPFEAAGDGYHASAGGLTFTIQAGGVRAHSEGLAYSLGSAAVAVFVKAVDDALAA